MDRVAAESECDRLARLQRVLLTGVGGTGSAGDGEAVGRGMRRRLARLALEDAIRSDAAAQAQCRREEFDRALAEMVERVSRRPPVSAGAPPGPGALPPSMRTASPPVAPSRPVPKQAAGSPSAPAVPARRPRRTRRCAPPPAPLPQFWTPGVVLGFRMWDLRGRLFGAWKPWDRPEYEAGCGSRRAGADDGDVPHTDGRCGYPPCGLYCFKEPEQLLAAFGLPEGGRRAVLGLVSLSGKVVEHEHGYRARRARVLAAAVVGRGRVVRVEGEVPLRRLFARPEETISGLITADPGAVEETADPVQMAESVLAYLALARDFHLSAG